MRRFPDHKLGDGQITANPPVSRKLHEGVAAHALNTSTGDHQLQEPLVHESLQVRAKAELDALRVSSISWEA